MIIERIHPKNVQEGCCGSFTSCDREGTMCRLSLAEYIRLRQIGNNERANLEIDCFQIIRNIRYFTGESAALR